MSKQASKRGLTLDLNGPAKKTRLSVPHPSASSANPPILTTPDVQMLKLSSPELAKFLNSNPTLATPTPSGYLFPKTVTEEQELYAKGFEMALENMHKQVPHPPGPLATTTTTTLMPLVSLPPPTATTKTNETAISTIERATAAHRSSLAISTVTTAADHLPVDQLLHHPLHVSSRPSSGASGSIDSSEGRYEVRVKEEEEDDDDDDDDDSSDDDDVGLRARRSGMSPIDMESQEKIKLERKRMRNRLAASKCRKRKLERISQLDDKVMKLKGENGELASVVKKLKEAVCGLKQEVMEHMNSGCQLMMGDMSSL